MLEKIAKIIKEYKDDDSLVITAQSTFEDLDLDSLDSVEIAMSLEEEFGVTIELNESIVTIGDIMNLIEAQA